LFLALTGCAMGPNSPDFGDANHNNGAVQSVQPTPPPAAQPVPGNGERAAIAQSRYAHDAVKEPAATSTSSAGGGGGGGGSGGSGGSSGASTSTGP